MRYMIVVVVIFLVLLMAPFLNAWFCCRKKGSVLYIEQNYARDARYFGKSFARMIENNISSLKEGDLFLSRKEGFIDGHTKEMKEETEKVVICLGEDFQSPENTKVFKKEIYGDGNVKIADGGVRVRAVYAKKKLVLGNRTDVVRWVDAEETAAVYDECSLGISASAGKKLSVGKNCTFHRLYAPEILIGQYPDDCKDAMRGRDARIFEISGKLEIKRNITYIDKTLLDGKDEAKFTVLSKYNVMVLENIILRGDLRSHKNVRICDNAVVCGNIFAEGDIHIGRNAVVLGNIFSQGNISFEEDAMVGQRGKIVSVIARNKIIFEGSTYVFGYISCEGGGIVKSAGNRKKEHGREFLSLKEEKKELVFEDPRDYEKVMEQGYRKVENLQKVVIPHMAKEVPRSMFFACTSLRNVRLPETIEMIDAYAFADCRALEEFTGFAGMKLKKIGTSAFENCVCLRQADFPKELEYLGGAAFAGCTGLRSVTFAENSGLKVIEDHCFRDCEALERIELPDLLEKVGVSAFAGCKSLRYVSVPAACAREPGIEELKQIAGLRTDIRDVKKNEGNET